MKKKISKKINLSDLATQKQLKDVSKEMHHYGRITVIEAKI